MKHHNLLRRFLCALLAAELFFAPAAMARAANPLLVFEGEERESAASVPMAGEPSQVSGGEEREESSARRETTASAELSGLEDSYNEVSFAAAVSPGLALGGVTTTALTLFDHKLTYELAAGAQSNASPWILRLPDDEESSFRGPKYLTKYSGEDGDRYYILLPDSGRVPDYELEGYYVVQNGSGAIPANPDSEGRYWHEGNREAGYYANREAVAAWRYEASTFSDRYPLNRDESYDGMSDEAKETYLSTLGVLDSDDVDVNQNAYAQGSLWYFTAEQMEAMAEAGAMDLVVETDEEGYSMATYYLPLVAKWGKSSKAQVRALALNTATEKDGETTTAVETLYTANPRTDASAGTVNTGDINTETTQTEFWYIAGKDQAYLNLNLTAFEPYFDYVDKETGTCPLTVTCRAGDGAETTVAAENITAELLPAAEVDGADVTPKNSTTDPARSEWMVKNIPLTSAENISGTDKNNTIQITLTAPNGTTQKTLTLHVERVTDAVGTLGYGNTPAGLIWADEGSQWGTEAAKIRENKENSIQYFKDNHSFENMAIKPEGTTLYQGEYSTLAWAGGKNLDLDETAVVAYLDSAFDDPGVRFTDCQGNAVVYGASAEGAYQTCVTRTIKLKTAEKLTIDLYTDANGGTTQWYTAGGLKNTETAQTLTKSDGSDVVNLRGMNIIPGIYEMEYTFTDPLENGKTTSVTRKLVILPIPGDVDMDGAVTAADARAIKSNKESWENSAAATKTRTKLLQYRVYNVKKGSNTAEGAIWDGFQPVAPGESTTTDYFYPPLSATGLGETYSRMTWGQVEGSSEGEGTTTGALTLEYLGKENGTVNAAGAVTNLTGPWGASDSAPISQGDVFWVGIKLDAGSSGLRGKELQDLTLTLTYDSNFVTPAVIYDASDSAGNVEAANRWTMLTLYDFNMRGGENSKASQEDSVLYGINADQYNWKSSSFDRGYSTHYSKVKGGLESGNSTGTLREMTFTLQHQSGSRVTLKDGYLLVVPFQLVSQPAGESYGSFIELAAGMKELVITTVDTSAVAALLRGVSPLAELLGIGKSETTRAFSAQKSIFGGSTENLRDTVNVTAAGGSGNSRAVLAVPLGENTTPPTTLYDKNGKNAVYGEAFDITLPDLHRGALTSGALPVGMSYDESLGRIYGTPTRAETYDFTIGGKAFRIVVEKRVLHYSVHSVSSYYGETTYRGDDATEDFTFKYTVNDLYQADYDALLAANANRLDGNGTELNVTTGTDESRTQVLAGYKPATLAAKEGEGATSLTVTQKTSVRSALFPIVTITEAQADNYTFVRTDQATLQILRRPVWIEAITVSYPKEDPTVFVYNNDGPSKAVNFTLEEKEGENPSAEDAQVTFSRPTGSETSYDNHPLSGVNRVAGDVFTLTFTGNYSLNAEDRENTDSTTSNWFILQNSVEWRNVVSVRNIQLTGDCAVNYTLQNTEIGDTNSHIQAPVVRRDIETIQITDYPPVLQENGSISAGEVVSSDQSLRVMLALSNEQAGDFSYIYIGSDLKAWNLHYNWVSPEDKAQGEANSSAGVGMGWTYDPSKADNAQVDNCAYGTKTIITADMNGWYLCVSARKKDGTFIKVYSERSLKVTKRYLSLTPQASTRFYGEEENLTYRYDISGLSTADRQAILEHFNLSTPKGTQAELEWLLEEKYGTEADYALPKLEGSTAIAIPGERERTSKTTPVNGQKYVVLSGGSCSAYNFLYYQAYGAGATTGDNKSGWSSAFGTALLTVKRRPVMVEAVYTPDETAEGGRTKDNFATIYADTFSLKLTGQQDGDTFTPFKTPLKQGDVKLVEFKLPTTDTQGYYSYYTGLTSTAETASQSLSGDAVLDDDLAGLEVSYAVHFLPDVGHNAWQDMATNWFDSENDKRPVEIRDLALSGARAANYILVYRDSNRAQQKVPDAAELDTAQNRYNPTTPGVTHLVYGQGNVILRPIKTMELQYLGRLDYTYGETFSPGEAGENNRCFTLKVSYDTQYGENAAPYNTTSSETVEYALVPMNNADGTVTYSDSFTQRGFTFHYLKAGQRAEEVGEGQTLTRGDKLSPADHNGARVYITGKRSAGDDTIYSTITDKTVLKVAKANLTVKATDAHRFYGEANPAGDFTFTLNDLAEWDLEELHLTTALTKNQQGTSAQFETVFGTNAKNGIAVSSAATATSDAYDGAHDYGSYPMTAKVTGATAKTLLKNYNLTLEAGTLYVYPRPIRVTSIENGEDNPIYTVYSATQLSQFQTAFTTDTTDNPNPVTVEVATIGGGQSVYGQTLANGLYQELPVNGDGLVNQDQLTFTATVIFTPGEWDLSGGEADQTKQKVTLTELKLDSSDAARNYSDIGSTIATEARFWGRVKLRTINSIYIVGKPATMDYTYPESLNLSGLKVSIGYAGLDGEANITATVPFLSTEQFESYGLYVNYVDPTYTLPTDDASRKALPDTLRKAATGDHLTIAPTHDTQGTRNPWAANGKYLVISAFQPGNEQTAAAPKIVGQQTTKDGMQVYEGTAIPITVSPQKLTFDLSAADKTYDGTTAAAGTLTLTNLFDKEAQTQVKKVGDKNQVQSEKITDAVYVPIGAGYESSSSDYRQFSALTSQVSGGKVAFTTGTYENTAQDALSDNDVIHWASKYLFGTHLTFNFVNANVHYADEMSTQGFASAEMWRYWRANQAKNVANGAWDHYGTVTEMPVEVTNMTLAGPDAANYTWGESSESRVETTAVTMETRAEEQDGQAAAPYATIHKANRATIAQTLAAQALWPSLQLDLHSNAIRFVYNEALLSDLANRWNNANTNSGESDDFMDELHFEYALFYQDGDLLKQWAGKDGNALRGYQDTRFFGGETVGVNVDAGYEPDPERLDKEENAGEDILYKGQVYPWAGEDTGVSAKGYVEDGGFTQDNDAYPGGAGFAEYYDWYYTLYTTDRAALPRDTVFYPLIRLSETHNYNASAPITGSEDVPSALLLAAQEAAGKLAEDDTPANREAAQNASQAVFAAAEGNMTAAAAKASKDKKDYDADLAEKGQWPEDWEPGPLEASALKTFVQRIDLVSASKERMDGDDTEYLVEMLEAVWFTDTQFFDESKQLDAVVWNHPTRYYGYYWDTRLSTALKFTEEPYINLEDAFTVDIRDKDGNEIPTLVNENNNARIYVSITDDGGKEVRKIQIVPSILYARLGDEPYPLSLITDPPRPSNRRYKWTTSDASVATVDEAGVVTFRGVGRCVITVTASNGRNASISVIVSAALMLDSYETPIFNFYYDQPWEKLNDKGEFDPHAQMTRGELALLLDKFLNPNGSWQATTELAYLDIQEGDKYYDALRRLTGAKVIYGVPGSRFAPEQPVTRAELAAMLSRMLRLNLPAWEDESVFQDSTREDTWAWAYIDALAKTGAMRGVGGGCFAPERVLTREEAAAVLARLLVTRLDREEPGLLHPVDMGPENWSYEAVLRAINGVIEQNL